MTPTCPTCGSEVRVVGSEQEARAALSTEPTPSEAGEGVTLTVFADPADVLEAKLDRLLALLSPNADAADLAALEAEADALGQLDPDSDQPDEGDEPEDEATGT